MSDAPVIVWFRQDLRLADNAALLAAARTGRPVLACYILDESIDRAPGGAGRWWLHHSLTSLARDLDRRGGRLLLRRGDGAGEIAKLAAETGAAAVYSTAVPTPPAMATDESAAAALQATGAGFHRLPGALLFETDAVRTRAGQPFRVFTPFARACLGLTVPPPAAAPREIRFADTDVARDDLEDWRLEPRQPNWAAGFESRWRPGEHGAHTRLSQFVEAVIGGYAVRRDRPDLDGTSGISPHLAWGEVSPRQVWQAARSVAASRAAASAGTDAWLRQLLWREFSYHLLCHWPQLPDEPLRDEFAAFPWARNDEALMRWQNGITGYPFVDAGMRELWQTGWMHNRVRMVAASFLVKDLLIPWQQGAAWFWDTLVDADLANNSAGWQWVAGCGADAAPYFRIFNPVTQGRKFDPEGDYVRRYVPEIAALPDRFVHAPWTAPARVLEEAGIVPGADYPAPVVEHAVARRRALEAFQTLRANGRPV